MKQTIFTLLALLGTAAAGAQVRFTEGPTDLLRERAARENKLVFIDLYAEWCPPCRAMERQVFAREDVGDFMEQYFVAARYTADQSRTGRALMKRYGNGSVPLFLIFDTEGHLLGRITGAASAENFVTDLKTILTRRTLDNPSVP